MVGLVAESAEGRGPPLDGCTGYSSVNGSAERNDDKTVIRVVQVCFLACILVLQFSHAPSKAYTSTSTFFQPRTEEPSIDVEPFPTKFTKEPKSLNHLIKHLKMQNDLTNHLRLVSAHSAKTRNNTMRRLADPSRLDAPNRFGEDEIHGDVKTSTRYHA